MHSSLESSNDLVVLRDHLVSASEKKLRNRLIQLGVPPAQKQLYALRDLLCGIADQSLGLDRGRIAYPLPCGTGKTQAITAFLAVARELCPHLSFVVAAQQVMALGRIRRDLTELGVCATDVGLQHSLSSAALNRRINDSGERDLGPFLQTTGEADPPILLVCHARVSGSSLAGEACYFQGKPRSLVIWDETFFDYQHHVIGLRDARSAIHRIAPECEGDEKLHSFLSDYARLLEREESAQRMDAKPSALEVDAEAVDDAMQRLSLLPTGGTRFRREALTTLRSMLSLATQKFSLLLSGNGSSGDGLIGFSDAVPSSVDNIAILDASFSVRSLAKSATVRDGSTAAMTTWKRFDRLTIKQYPISSGKVGLMTCREKHWNLARTVADYIKGLPVDDHVLLVTFKGDNDRDMKSAMHANLSALGVDVAAKIEGGDRFAWLTWGNETSLNTVKHCRHVVLCGVLRREALDVSAAAAACKGDLLLRLDRAGQQDAVTSEVAHCVLQAINRAACRDTDEHGQALPTDVAIFGNFKGLMARLAPCLPGADWSLVPVSSRAKDIKAVSIAIADYVATQAEKTTISLKRVRSELGIVLSRDDFTEAVNEALIDLAIRRATSQGARWIRRSRSLAVSV